MNEARAIDVDEQARIVLGLLKEYAEKLSSLNTDILEARTDPTRGLPLRTERAAWLLDQGELLKPPLSRIISRGSALLEHMNLDTVVEDELALRMREIEIHLHHTLRLTHELKQVFEQARNAEQIAKLRLAAGLNAMKGGPLRPE